MYNYFSYYSPQYKRGFEPLRVNHAYINDKNQVTKVGSSYSETLQTV